MNSYEITKLIERVGDIRLSEYAEILRKGRKHLCPKCNGTGQAMVRVPYPSGLPDSGWVDDSEELRQCDLCNGIGYTAEKMEAVTKIVNYRPATDGENE